MSERTGSTVDGSDIDAVERWFIDRGLPHFVERHDSASRIWARALPLLVFAYLLLGLNALDLRNWSRERNLAVAAFVIAASIITWFVANWLRGRRWVERPRRVGAAELAVFVVAPAVPSLVLGQWGDALQTALTAVAILALLWGLTSYGVFALLRWAGQRTLSQLGLLFSVVVRALPLLLLFTTFLFINAEVWQVAGTLTGMVYMAVLAVFIVLGAIFVLSRVPSLMRQLDDFRTWAEIDELVTDTPAHALTGVVPPDRPPDRPPDKERLPLRQRLNIGLVTVFSQAIQITVVAFALTAFFVLFGFLAIPEDTARSWTGLDVIDIMASWTIDERRLVLSEPLVRVAAFLGAFSGMYFTVLLSTDATYREEFAEDVGPQVRQALAVRRLYQRARAAG